MKYFLVSFILLFLFISDSFANIINVPADIDSIQGGINLAVDGDTVLVDDGLYFENINFKGKAITVASHFYMDGDTSHIANTIIDGSTPSHPDSGSVVCFLSGEDTTSILTGFTIRNGTGTQSYWTMNNAQYDCRVGGGIYCRNSGASLIFNKIINNSINHEERGLGCGITIGEFGNDAYVIIENNTITNNTINSTNVAAAGGIMILCNGRIVNNIISHNSCISTGDEALGGGIRTATLPEYPCTVTIKGNTISNNFVKGKGIAGNNYWASSGSGIANWHIKVILLDNDIFDNVLKSDGSGSGGGAGIYMIQTAYGCEINGNLIFNNKNEVTSLKYGGGIAIGQCTGMSITNNIIYNNYATYGAGIRLIDNSAQIINNTIVNNKASIGGGGIHTYNSNPVVLNTILWGNEAPGNPQISGNATVRYSDVQGGYSGSGNRICEPCFCDSLYNLSDSSGCIGAGIDSLEISGTWYYAPRSDYKGAVRPNPVDPYVDIGAQESAFSPVGIIEERFDHLAKTYSLKQNYPNPFNPTTTIEFSIPRTEPVTLKIYNILGETVETLVSEKLHAGTYQYEWDAAWYASGVYIYRLEAGNYKAVKKMIVLK